MMSFIMPLCSLSSLKSPSTVGKTCIKQHLYALKQLQRHVSRKETYMGMFLAHALHIYPSSTHISCLLCFVLAIYMNELISVNALFFLCCFDKHDIRVSKTMCLWEIQI